MIDDGEIYNKAKEKGRIRYSDEFYKAASMVTAVGHTSLDGFCGCGTDAEWGIVYHLLKAMNGEVQEPDECIREYMEQSGSPTCWGFDKDGHEIKSPFNSWGFPHTPMSEFLAKFLDSVGLTEHGTTVVWSWLDMKGKAFVRAMDVCIDEYCEVNGLDKAEFHEGPFGFSIFDASSWWGSDDDVGIELPEWVFALEQHLVMDANIAQDVAYRLFTGGEKCMWWNESDEHKEKVDQMLNEILDLKKREEEEE